MVDAKACTSVTGRQSQQLMSISYSSVVSMHTVTTEALEHYSLSCGLEYHLRANSGKLLEFITKSEIQITQTGQT